MSTTAQTAPILETHILEHNHAAHVAGGWCVDSCDLCTALCDCSIAHQLENGDDLAHVDGCAACEAETAEAIAEKRYAP